MGEITSRPSLGRDRLRRLATKALAGPELAEAYPGPASLLAISLWFGAVTGLLELGPGPPPQVDFQHPHLRDVAEESAFRLDDPRVEPADLRGRGTPDRPRRPIPAQTDFPPRLLSARVRRIAGLTAPHPAPLPARLFPPGLRGGVPGRPAFRSPRAWIPAHRPPEPAGAPDRRRGSHRPGLPPRGLDGAPGVGGSPGGPSPAAPQRADDRARHGPRRSPRALTDITAIRPPTWPDWPPAGSGSSRRDRRPPGRSPRTPACSPADGPTSSPHGPAIPLDATYPTLAEVLSRKGYASAVLRRQHAQLQRLVRPRSGVRPYEDFYRNTEASTTEILFSSSLGRSSSRPAG